MEERFSVILSDKNKSDVFHFSFFIFSFRRKQLLKKTYRLVKRGSFTFVYNKGERKSDKLLSLVYVHAKGLRIGFSVPNKVGKAVVRNKLKRRLRAFVCTQIPFLKPVQAVVTARAGADKLSYQELCASLRELFARAKLLTN